MIEIEFLLLKLWKFGSKNQTMLRTFRLHVVVIFLMIQFRFNTLNAQFRSHVKRATFIEQLLLWIRFLYIKNKQAKIYHNTSQKIDWDTQKKDEQIDTRTKLRHFTWKKRKAVRINLKDTCIECYNKNSRMLGSKMAKNLTQKVTIFCNQFNKQTSSLFTLF